jgi:hypothetical protein
VEGAGQLVYFKGDDCAEQKGVIDLTGAKIRRRKDTKHSNLFEISPLTDKADGRVYELYAETEKELRMWITSLERVTKAKRKGKAYLNNSKTSAAGGKIRIAKAGSSGKLSAKQQKEQFRFEIEEEERKRAEEAALRKKQADAVIKAQQQKGWLTKKGAGTSALSRRNWKRRWFKLDGKTLVYFSSRTAVEPKGRMALSGCEIRVRQDSKYEYHFEVWHIDRQLQLRADSRGDLEKWRVALQTIIGDAQEQGTPMLMAV